MKFASALTTFVSLTTLASALPSQQLAKRQQFSNATGAAVDATNANGTLSTNGTVPTNGTAAGNGVGAVNTANPVTQTVIQTITSTVSQLYSTFVTTEVVTATLVFPAGAGVGAVATAVVLNPAATGSSSTPAVAGTGSSPAVAGSGAAAAAVGAASGSGSGAAAAGAAGTAATTVATSGSTCACAAPVVVATGIYTVTVENIINLGTTTYTTSYATTTLGVISISGGSIVAAVPTVTNSAVVATNTAAALPSGQKYQTVTIPASGSTAAYQIVVIVSVVTDVVVPVSSSTAANGGNGVGAVGLPGSSSAPFLNGSTSATTLSASGASSARPALSTVSSLASSLPGSVTSAPTSSASAGANVGAAETASSGQSAEATSALAAASSSTTQAAAASTALAPNTQAAVIGSQGTTPLEDQTAFADAILAAHNSYRARHGAPAMTYSDTLAATALANVNANAADGTFLHTVDMGISDPYGENIAEQYGANNPEYLVYLWYNEISLYNYSNPVYNESYGHFTQVVWDASTELGCAYVQTTDANSDYLLACEYNSPGNVEGEFAANVNPVVAGAAAYSAPAANAS